ncbi:MAG: hypothetical protein QXH91_07445 [Candidatus Bathyarchaeia archaeon]
MPAHVFEIYTYIYGNEKNEVRRCKATAQCVNLKRTVTARNNVLLWAIGRATKATANPVSDGINITKN